jgi:DivIVA domain-containing protein
MSSTDLGLPPLPTSDQVRRREFATIRRGYDPEQVRDYLQQIATQVETLELQLREAKLDADAQEQVVTLPESGPADDPYERLAARVADVLRAADERAERILRDAREEASLALSQARTETGRMRADAQSRAEEARQQANEILKKARVEAERVLSLLAGRRATFVEQLQQMQARLIGVAEQLETGSRESDLLPATSEEPLSTRWIASKPDVGGPATEDGNGDDLIDPRYEDLWS